MLISLQGGRDPCLSTQNPKNWAVGVSKSGLGSAQSYDVLLPHGEELGEVVAQLLIGLGPSYPIVDVISMTTAFELCGRGPTRALCLRSTVLLPKWQSSGLDQANRGPNGEGLPGESRG